MRFRSLGSGSAGNATLVESTSGGAGTTRVLVDCGFGLREMETRLQRAGLIPADVDLIFVTHEHGDHIGSALSFAKRHGTRLAMSQGTWRAVASDADASGHTVARDGECFRVGKLALAPFTVPHDAREPLQLRISEDQLSLGLLTDTGCETPHVVASLQDCDALLLECNHDETLLATGPYPPALKQRVGGRLGHLANQQAASILAQCAHPRLRHVVAAHLSEQNNTPELARTAIQEALALRQVNTCAVLTASQSCGTDWISL
jgi:phosphoribosyl 1,2-cyclic phosphodiesterase